MGETPGVQFAATLEPSGGWVCIVLPKKASAELGSRERIPVIGTLNGFPIRTSVFPRGDGTHMMLVNKEMQRGVGVVVGDRANVVLEKDTRPRIVAVPTDLRRVLARSKKAGAAFARLSYTHRKEYVNWINGAKRPETRARRIQKTVAALLAGGKMRRGRGSR